MKQKTFNLKNFYARWYFVPALIAVLVVTSNTKVHAQLDWDDAFALEELYYDTDGDNWDRNDGWLTYPYNSWEGVYTSNSRVIRLELDNNEMNGTLPDDIGDLTAITYLDLSYNYTISGSIPSTIGNLINLEYLSLFENSLSGNIPSTIGNLSNLETLWLDDNNLTGIIPSELGDLSNLTDLDLSDNNLTGSIPESIAFLPNLDNLNLSNNNLYREIPFVYYYALTIDGLNMDIRNNKFVFADLPCNCPNLTYAPQQKIGQTTSIEVPCYSSYTVTIGYEPHTNDSYNWYKVGSSTPVGTSLNLTITDFDISDEGEYYCVITNSSFPDLTLTSYNITLTASYGNISQTEYEALRALYVSTNGDNWTNTVNNNGVWFEDYNVENWYGINTLNGKVRNIELINNNLSGTLPNNFDELDSLFTILIIGNPLLTGSIPTSLGSLNELGWIDLMYNNLTGSIPSELCNCESLVYLTLEENNLSGVVPECLCNTSINWYFGGISSIKPGNNFDESNLPTCWSTMKSATIIDENFDPSIRMHECIEEAINTGIPNNELSDYIDRCMTEKMQAQSPTSTNEFSFVDKVKAYPNPTTGILNIDSPYENAELTLFNFAGQQVKQQAICGSESIDISELTKGIYLMVIDAEGQQETMKITLK